MNVVGAGEASGAAATHRAGQVFTFREGQISAIDNYWEAAEALEAVGLSGSRRHRSCKQTHSGAGVGGNTVA